MKTALVICALASTAMAQFSVGPQTATYNANTSRGFNFVANLDFYINQLDVPTDNQFPGDLASYYVEVNGVPVFLAVNQPGAVITPSIPQIMTGDAVTIVGHWNSATTAHNSYASGAPLVANLEGVPHTFYRAAGSGIMLPGFVGGNYGANFSGFMGRCDVYTSLTPPVGIAQNTAYGNGCGGNGSTPAFYQLFADATAASATLNDGSLFLTPGASGYQGAWAPASAAGLFVAPTAAATPLVVGDDGQVAYAPVFGPVPTPYGPQASLRVHGNAIIGFGGGAITYPGTTSYTPTSGGFVGNPLGGIYAWHDYNTNEGGQVLAEEVGNLLYITYDAVESYSSPAGPNPSTLQFQFDMLTGDVRVLFVSIDADATSTFGSAHLIGAVAPGGSNDPGSIDLLTATPAQLEMIATTEDLALVGATRPIIGTNWELRTDNIEAVSPISLTFLGTSSPVGLPLLAIGLNAPGCDINLASSVGNLDGPNVAGSATVSLPLPNNPALIGQLFAAQSVALSLSNAAGITSSNGLEGLFGDS